jgi:hypothetical protein
MQNPFIIISKQGQNTTRTDDDTTPSTEDTEPHDDDMDGLEDTVTEPHNDLTASFDVARRPVVDQPEIAEVYAFLLRSKLMHSLIKYKKYFV